MPDMIDTMREYGIVFTGHLIHDGRVHRFPTENPRKKNGWYISHGTHGCFGDWARDLHVFWRADYRKHHPTPTTRCDALRRHRKTPMERWREAAKKACMIWHSLPAHGANLYLERKQISAFGLRFRQNAVLVPLRDVDGTLWSIQTITDTDKWFMSGGRVKGCFHMLGDIRPDGFLYITEGYATAASIHMATGSTTLVAFNAGNIEPVMTAVTERYPNIGVCIAADDDRWKARNIGRETAYRVANRFGCDVVLPRFASTDGEPTDFNDLHILEGIETVREQLEVRYVST